jgi:hypothetical protein
MSINFDRLSVLAGLPVEKSNLKEGKDHEEVSEEAEQEVEEAAMYEEDDELLEIDEAMLVQELRRAKRIVQENKRRNQKEQSSQQLFENNLKQIIDEEVKNVLKDLNLNSSWVYGNNKPTRSRKGYTHQGSFLPGLGFKK